MINRLINRPIIAAGGMTAALSAMVLPISLRLESNSAERFSENYAGQYVQVGSRAGIVLDRTHSLEFCSNKRSVAFQSLAVNNDFSKFSLSDEVECFPAPNATYAPRDTTPSTSFKMTEGNFKEMDIFPFASVRMESEDAFVTQSDLSLDLIMGNSSAGYTQTTCNTSVLQKSILGERGHHEIVTHEYQLQIERCDQEVGDDILGHSAYLLVDRVDSEYDLWRPKDLKVIDQDRSSFLQTNGTYSIPTFGYGSYACFPGSAFLKTENGFISFDEMSELMSSGQQLPAIASYDEDTGEEVFQVPRKFIDHGFVSTNLMTVVTVNVETGELESLVVTDNHRLFVETDSGEREWKQAGELEEADMIIGNEGKLYDVDLGATTLTETSLPLYNLSFLSDQTGLWPNYFVSTNAEGNDWFLAHNLK